MKNCQIVFPKNLTELEAALSPEQRAEVTLVKLAIPPPKPPAPPSKCFIATAACGTDQADDVMRLQLFRERVLRQSSAGQLAIDLYENFSPALARLIARRRCLRFLTRTLQVRPARVLADWLLAK